MSRRPAHLRDPAYRARVIEAFLRDELGAGDAARMLHMGARNFRRLRILYSANGVAGLANGLAGKRSNRAFKPEIRRKVIALLRSRYKGLAAKRVSRRLAREESITISSTTLITWMVEEGLWQTRTRRQAGLRAAVTTSNAIDSYDETAINTVRQILGLPDSDRDTLLLPRISGQEDVDRRVMLIARTLLVAAQNPLTEKRIAAYVKAVDPELHAQMVLLDHLRAHDQEALRRRARQHLERNPQRFSSPTARDRSGASRSWPRRP